MTEFVREWVLGIVAVSMITAAAKAMTEGSPSERVVRLMTAVSLFIAVILPFSGNSIDLEAEALDFKYEYGLDNTEQTAGELLRGAMERELEAQALSRAKEIGIDCEVDIYCRYSDGCIVPASCIITGNDAASLEEWVRTNYGIEEITYNGG